MERYDVVVIGGGGTGSEVAFQLGRRSDLRVALIERDVLGGECNHYGCVPTKVMLRSARIAQLAREAERFGVRTGPVEVDLRAVQRRARDVVAAQSREGAAPFERVGVTVLMTQARLAGERRVELDDGTVLEADRVVLATGSAPTAPPIDGLADGPYWTNRGAIWEPERPPASLAVVGSGAIGSEFAQAYARFGTRVTLLEALPRIVPLEDEDASTPLARALTDEGVDVRAGVRISSARHDGSAWRLAVDGPEEVVAERLLVATGRRPVFDVHDLRSAGVELDDGGRPVLTETLRTTADGVWAAGDATGELLFTHVGTYEAEIVVDDILGSPRPRDYRVVPRVTFTDPEVASVGLTEAQARGAAHDVRTAVVDLVDSERARIDGTTTGVVKLVGDAATGELVGAHVVAEDAGAILHELVAAMAGRVPVATLAGTIHAYPTLSEAVRDAAVVLASRMR